MGKVTKSQNQYSAITIHPDAIPVKFNQSLPPVGTESEARTIGPGPAWPKAMPCAWPMAMAMAMGLGPALGPAWPEAMPLSHGHVPMVPMDVDAFSAPPGAIGGCGGPLAPLLNPPNPWRGLYPLRCRPPLVITEFLFSFGASLFERHCPNLSFQHLAAASGMIITR